MIRRGWLIGTAVLTAAGGAGASVLVSGVGAQAGQGCVTETSTAGRVVVTCNAVGAVTLPGGRAVTIDLAGGSGGGVGDLEGGRGAVAHVVWTPPADTAVWAVPGPAGAPGGDGRGALGGAASVIVPQPFLDQSATPGPWWLVVAGGGGGRGTSAELGAGGNGGADAVTGAGGGGGGGATGGTADRPGSGSPPGLPGLGPLGGLGLLGGGSGGLGYYGGGGGGNGGGGGAGGSRAAVGTATYAPAGAPGAGWARFSWVLTTPPAVTSAGSATFVVGQPETFTVSASGSPPPKLTVEGLPPGLTFTDGGDGTGLISGQPLPGNAGDYDVTVRASNGSDPDAVQHLLVRIVAPGTAPDRSPQPSPLTPDPAPPVGTTEAQKDPQMVPVAGKSVVVSPVAGTVYVRRPDGTVAELKEGEEIPVGSVVDTRDGVVRLTAARDSAGVVQTALFWDAIFTVTQQADRGAGRGRAAATPAKRLTVLTLKQRPTGCGRKARASGRKQRGGLWGDGKGRFRVRGNTSAATVRGTKWYVENRCAGTYTRVVRGVVAVRDFVKGKTVVVRAGGTYTADKRRRT